MANRIIVLTDLKGQPALSKQELHLIIGASEVHKSIERVDSRVLAEIPKSKWNKEEIHLAFIEGGIEMAVQNLNLLCKEKIDLIGYSIGGTIAWKTALSNENVDSIYAVSATRLRKELRKPDCRIRLLYGDQDLYTPGPNWCEELDLSPLVLTQARHEFYTQRKGQDLIQKDLSGFYQANL